MGVVAIQVMWLFEQFLSTAVSKWTVSSATALKISTTYTIWAQLLLNFSAYTIWVRSYYLLA